MSENNQSARGGHFMPALLLFCVTAGIAVVLLVAAAVAGIAELLGSLTWATLAVGGFFAAVAAGIYFLAIRGPLEQLRSRLETVYDVARLVKQAYDWVAGKFEFLIRLRDALW
ncbi:MAG: hypothetical protein NC209_03460 [Alistipes sp.]|nr:hypothetical protein [Alistipes senegalensis]MCM1250189.1 hypothetical protein [Alistipes sp.]